MAQQRDVNPNLLYMRFKFPKRCHDGKGRMLESIVVRETDSFDQQLAARAADGDKSSNFTRELARCSFVAYRYVGEKNDVLVQPPFPEFDGWTTRSGEFALRAFNVLNSVPEAEEELGKGQAVDPTTLATSG